MLVWLTPEYYMRNTSTKNQYGKYCWYVPQCLGLHFVESAEFNLYYSCVSLVLCALGRQ